MSQKYAAQSGGSLILGLFLLLKACAIGWFLFWMIRHIYRARKDERKP